jgi:hypothetical protein
MEWSCETISLESREFDSHAVDEHRNPTSSLSCVEYLYLLRL